MSERTRRSLEISMTSVFVLALLLVGAVLIFSGGTASAKQIATLHLFGGPVDIQARGSDTFRPGIEDASLHEGDTVRTGANGRASIEYFDGSLTRLDHATTFTLLTLESLGEGSDSKVIEAQQEGGNSYNRVAELTDQQGRFVVETPTATASVQGTVYALIVQNGATTVAVVQGVVETSGGDRSVSVPAGSMVVVDASGAVGAVQQISDELLNSSWLSFNLCDLDGDASCGEGDIPEPSGSPGKTPKNDSNGSGPHGNQPPKGSPTGPANGPPTVTGPGGHGDGPPPPPNANGSPVAGFTASPGTGEAPLDVQFADVSSDPDGEDLSRHWSFGDGSSQDGGTSPSHVYDDPGDYTVTLTVRDPHGATDTKSKTINVGSSPQFDHLVISPSNATIRAGGSQNYTAEAFDTEGHSMGNVTGNTSFSIDPNGSCSGNTCSANQPGNHTVTGTFSGDSDSATLVVEEPPPPPCPNYSLAFHARPPASIDAGRQFNVQVRVDVLQGGSSDGPLTISLSLSGGGFSGGETSATWTGQGTITFNHLTIDDPGSYAIAANAGCASSTDAASITVTGGGGSARQRRL